MKDKRRNKLAMPMVDSILGVRLGLCCRDGTSDNFQILPGLLARFNQKQP